MKPGSVLVRPGVGSDTHPGAGASTDATSPVLQRRSAPVSHRRSGSAGAAVDYTVVPDSEHLAALTDRERACLGNFAGQRAAGILAAKHAVRRLFGPEWTDDRIEVLRRQLAAPEVRLDGVAGLVTVSLSHSDGLAVAVAHVIPGGLVPCAR